VIEGFTAGLGGLEGDSVLLALGWPMNSEDQRRAELELESSAFPRRGRR